MSNDIVKGNWEELKGKIRQVWGKLADDDVSRFQGNWEELSGKVQAKYGHTKEKAWEEVESFKRKHLSDKTTNDDSCCGGSHKH